MSDMVRAWLDHTQQLDQEATPGPWKVQGAGDESTTWIDSPEGDVLIHDERGWGHMRENFTWVRQPDAEWIAHARTALPQAAAALRAVLDLHGSVEVEPSDTICGECSFRLPNGRYFGKLIEWPCPTVQAVQSALCDHQAWGITYRDPTTTCWACDCGHEWTETR